MSQNNGPQWPQDPQEPMKNDPSRTQGSFQPYGQNSYGNHQAQQGYGAEAPYQQENGQNGYVPSPYVSGEKPEQWRSITSLVLGIVSLLGMFVFLAPQIVGVVFGHIGLKKEPAAKGFAIAGLITNYIAIALFVIGAIFMIILIAAIGPAISDYNSTYAPSSPSPSFPSAPSDWGETPAT